MITKQKICSVIVLFLLLFLSLSTFSSSAQNPLSTLPGSTERVSVASDGTQGNGDSEWSFISADGQYVGFHSAANNLVIGDTNNKWDIFVHGQQTGLTTRVSVASNGTQGNASSS